MHYLGVLLIFNGVLGQYFFADPYISSKRRSKISIFLDIIIYIFMIQGLRETTEASPNISYYVRTDKQ